jgi:alpha-beta hydrolase superfamily lysophospholipase
VDILTRELSFDSSNGSDRIFVRIVEPADKSNVRAVLQIAHGMAEHSLLYMDFAKYIASFGFAVAMNDHLGHGKSVSTGGAFGYFGEGGCQNLINDMHKLHGIMRDAYPNLPYFLMGHSMGSFLARAYTSQFGTELAGAVYMGTSAGPGAAILEAQIIFANSVVKKRGIKGHDPVFEKLSIRKYNTAFVPNRTISDWISRDEAEVDRYVNDPLCGFDLAASGYRDILYLQKEINCADWYRRVPDIPILLISGDRDPVGEFGKGVKKVAKGLTKTGHRVQLILYPEARHALLSETNKDEVHGDIYNFLDSALSNLTVQG